MEYLRFEKVSMQSCFYFISFDIVRISDQDFIKINVLDKVSNTTIAIYEKYNEDAVEELTKFQDFQNVDNNISVIYKNGRLKFVFILNR